MAEANTGACPPENGRAPADTGQPDRTDSVPYFRERRRLAKLVQMDRRLAHSEAIRAFRIESGTGRSEAFGGTES